MLTLSAWAVPARRVWTTMTQPDGTTIRVMTVGDEFCHYTLTDDGTVVVRDDSGWFRPAGEEELLNKRENAALRRQHANARRQARLAAAQRHEVLTSAHDVGARSNYSGEKRGLVILVNFSNKTIKSGRQAIDNMFNLTGYNKNNHIGSVRDYFLDQSYGQLTIDFDVVGPVTLDNNYAYYGKNDSDGNDENASLMIEDACRAADADVDFSLYDWDGDGEVDQVYVIYAGYGENYASSDENTIWPHEWSLDDAKYYGVGSGALTLDGVRVNTYACSAELAYTSGLTLNGIGTACHEFSHCLGFPDFYDSEYKLCPSMLDWDLLDAGSYNGPNYLGEVPVGYTAYERWMAGWLDFVTLDAPCAVTDMANLGDSSRAYIIYNEAEHNEAYILENRQQKRWFTYPESAHGMLIYHVDYDAEAWYENTVNSDATHPRMCVVPANNTYGEKDTANGIYNPTNLQLRGQLWPGYEGKTVLSNTSTPAAVTFNSNTDGSYLLNATVSDIAESDDGLISFSFGVVTSLSSPELGVTDKDAERPAACYDLLGRRVCSGTMKTNKQISIINNHLIIIAQ